MAANQTTYGCASRAKRVAIFKSEGWVPFGVIMMQRRIELGFTLETVAKAAGTHKGYISGIEHGKVNPPSAKSIGLLCEVLSLNKKVMVTKGWVEKAPLSILPDMIKMVENKV